MSDLEKRFNHHAPDGDKVSRHQEVRAELLAVAQRFDATLPDGREKSLALTKLEESMFWANAAIAREGVSA